MQRIGYYQKVFLNGRSTVSGVAPEQPKSSGPGTTLSGVHCGIQKSATGNGLGMERAACRMGVCFCSGRFFRAVLEPAKSCAYGDLRAKALPERV